ncbi:MAG: hypothetical protein AB2693_13365 [Candidatus Thiodiazotropha sp.]
MGIKIGDVECPGSGCADDIGVQANTQEEAQVLVDLASDFAGKQFYEIQADKSATVVTRHGRSPESQQISIMMDNEEIPIVNSATHLGLKRSSAFNDTITDTVNQNITKARRTVYSLLSSGLHGENGLDVETSLHLLKIYVIPVLLYGLEIILPPKKHLEQLELFHKKLLKQILSVPQNTADPAIYILSGFLPIREQVHIKVLNFFNNNICHQQESSVEKRLAYRQLAVKSMDSASWFIEIKKILWLYDLGEIEDILASPIPKLQWKRTVFKKVSQKVKRNLVDSALLYKSLKYLNKEEYTPGKIHPVLRIPLSSVREITRVPVKLKLLTGSYLFQSTRSAFNQNKIDPTCLLCGLESEDLPHFIFRCDTLNSIRAPILVDIEAEYRLLTGNAFDTQDLDYKLHILLDCTLFMQVKLDQLQKLEFHCKRLVYSLDAARYKMLSAIKPRKR